MFLKFDFVVDSGLGFDFFFSSQTSGLWFILWSNQKFQVNPIESKSGQRLKPCLAGNVFAKCFFVLV
jgi:hypothetical protein